MDTVTQNKQLKKSGIWIKLSIALSSIMFIRIIFATIASGIIYDSIFIMLILILCLVGISFNQKHQKSTLLLIIPLLCILSFEVFYTFPTFKTTNFISSTIGHHQITSNQENIVLVSDWSYGKSRGITKIELYFTKKDMSFTEIEALFIRRYGDEISIVPSGDKFDILNNGEKIAGYSVIPKENFDLVSLRRVSEEWWIGYHKDYYDLVC